MMTGNQSFVYVVDDDASVRKAFLRLLRSADLNAKTFSSAEDFFTETMQVDDSCIVLDVRMPGMTGFDLERNLNDRGMNIPVIVVSASDDVETREQARQLGAVSFFRKPVDDQALLDAIEWAISTAQRK